MGSGAKPSSVPTYPDRPGNGRPPFLNSPFLAKHNGNVLVASRSTQKSAPSPDPHNPHKERQCSEFHDNTHWYLPSDRLRAEFELVDSSIKDLIVSSDRKELCDATYLHRVVEHVLHHLAIAKPAPGMGTPENPTVVDVVRNVHFSTAVANLKAHRDLRLDAPMEQGQQKRNEANPGRGRSQRPISVEPQNRFNHPTVPQPPIIIDSDDPWGPKTTFEAVDQLLEGLQNVPTMSDGVFASATFQRISRNECKAHFDLYKKEVRTFQHKYIDICQRLKEWVNLDRQRRSVPLDSDDEDQAVNSLLGAPSIAHAASPPQSNDNGSLSPDALSDSFHLEPVVVPVNRQGLLRGRVTMNTTSRSNPHDRDLRVPLVGGQSGVSKKRKSETAEDIPNPHPSVRIKPNLQDSSLEMPVHILDVLTFATAETTKPEMLYTALQRLVNFAKDGLPSNLFTEFEPEQIQDLEAKYQKLRSHTLLRSEFDAALRRKLGLEPAAVFNSEEMFEQFVERAHAGWTKFLQRIVAPQ